MEPKPLERKLTAILYADIAGYSRLTSEDEEGTHRALSAYLDALTALIDCPPGKA
jgi:adenylate cyclase